MLLWNIGAEGQLHLGAIAATGTALYLLPGAPGVSSSSGHGAGGFHRRGAVGSDTRPLRAYLKVNEIITSLDAQLRGDPLREYLVYGPWKNPQGFGFPGTPRPDAAWLPPWHHPRSPGPAFRADRRGGPLRDTCGEPGGATRSG